MRYRKGRYRSGLWAIHCEGNTVNKYARDKLERELRTFSGLRGESEASKARLDEPLNRPSHLVTLLSTRSPP